MRYMSSEPCENGEIVRSFLVGVITKGKKICLKVCYGGANVGLVKA